jgi:uncharacterized BrkB/YihY/UPF0761 family membrane protein
MARDYGTALAAGFLSAQSLMRAHTAGYPLMDQQLIVQKLEFIAPALGQLLGNNIDEIIQARGPVTGVALVGLIWSASTIFYMLTQTLNGYLG